jgi:hypothetical protein
VYVRPKALLIGLTVLIVFVTVGILIATHKVKNPLPPIIARSDYCTAQSKTGIITLDVDQMANAATITAIGIRRQVPAKAITIALATALQESKLRNLSGGDRDSIGRFQQRPSQGWGTPAQVGNPAYAANRFYGALVRVKHWQTLSVTQAAQAVQHSGFPGAYAQWEDEADTLSQALLSTTSYAVACYVASEPVRSGSAALGVLAKAFKSDWGTLASLEYAAAPDTMALSVTETKAGWQYAHWLVAHAHDSGIMRVRFGNQQWTAKGGVWGKAGDPETSAPGETVVAEVFA